MPEWADESFKAAMINMSKDLKEKIIVRSAEIGNVRREMENATKNQILEPRSTMHEMNTSFDGILLMRRRRQKKRYPNSATVACGVRVTGVPEGERKQELEQKKKLEKKKRPKKH